MYPGRACVLHHALAKRYECVAPMQRRGDDELMGRADRLLVLVIDDDLRYARQVRGAFGVVRV